VDLYGTHNDSVDCLVQTNDDIALQGELVDYGEDDDQGTNASDLGSLHRYNRTCSCIVKGEYECVCEGVYVNACVRLNYLCVQ